jgi:SAM-dependent methyltransferase
MHEDGNAVTLESYQRGCQQYLAGTPDFMPDSHKSWLLDALALRPAGSTVLEVGSGPGYDAAFMETMGARVERTDATAGFVAHLRNQGHAARQLNVLTDELGGPYGMVYAFAVFQHFEEYQCNLALQRCADALIPGGVLAVSFREGGTAEWQERKGMERRLFWFWRPGLLWHTVERTGLTMVTMSQAVSDKEDAAREVKTWLLVTAVKQ